MADQKKRKMRNLLINKSTQGIQIAIVIWAGFFSSLFCGALFYIYVENVYDRVFGSTVMPDSMVEEYYADLWEFGLSLVLISILVTMITAFFALIISHRSAGACYRLHAVIEEIKAGKTSARVYLRKRDDYKLLAQSFNEMMDGLVPPEKSEDSGEETPQA